MRASKWVNVFAPHVAKAFPTSKSKKLLQVAKLPEEIKRCISILKQSLLAECFVLPEKEAIGRDCSQ